jgi:hypothetical protein
VVRRRLVASDLLHDVAERHIGQQCQAEHVGSIGPVEVPFAKEQLRRCRREFDNGRPLSFLEIGGET